MAAKRPLNIGLVGCGFMGRAHSNAWSKVNNFFDLEYQPVLQAVCARNPDEVQGFAEQWGYDSTETDWRALVARDDIDLIDIASPNDTHAEIAIAAAAAGKMVTTEKPLARGGAESERMVEAVDAAGVPNMVWYNYRRVPAVTLAKQLIDEGRLGKIFHYRAKFLQDWTISKDLPQGGAALWRLDVNVAGSGVTGDLLAHCIDTALWLNGDIDRVSAMTETFITERQHTLTGKVEPVGIDDASAFLARFANGSLGTFEATRYARGHKALYTLEINGEHASIVWDLHDLHRLVVLRSRRRGPSARLALHPHHRRRPPLHGALVGAGPADRLRALLRPPGRRLPDRPGVRRADHPHVPRGAGDRLRHRRGAEISEVGAVGAREKGGVKDHSMTLAVRIENGRLSRMRSRSQHGSLARSHQFPRSYPRG